MFKNPEYQAKKQESIEFWQKKFGPLDDAINWSGPNRWSVVVILIALATSRIPIHSQYFGFLSYDHAFALGASILGGLVNRTIASYRYAIRDFVPKDALPAKRANEQIKLFATLLNSSAVGIVGVVSLRELFASPTPDYTLVVVSIALALYVHCHGRGVLSNLKNEAF